MRKQLRYVVGGFIGAAMLAGVAFAASSDTMDAGNYGCPGYGRQVQLTAEQQKEMQPIYEKMASLHTQMIETRKEALQKEVAFGTITQAEADQMISRMNERMANGGNGLCGRNGGGMMCRAHGMGHRGGNCW